MLMGNAPFSGSDDNETFQKIADYDFNKDKNYEKLSESAQNLIMKILVAEKDKRIEYEDILTHEWFTGEASKDEETKETTSTESNNKENVTFNSFSSKPSHHSTKSMVKVVNLMQYNNSNKLLGKGDLS